MAFTAKITIYPETIPKWEAKVKKAQKNLAKNVLADSTPYVPYDTGRTTKSGKAGDDTVTWSTPYVRIIYYKAMNWQRTHHPLATEQWFEKSKAVNLDKWIRSAESDLKG